MSTKITLKHRNFYRSCGFYQILSNFQKTSKKKEILWIKGRGSSIYTLFTLLITLYNLFYKENAMKYVKLGTTGMDVSAFCLGCMTYGKPPAGMPGHQWALDEDESWKFIKAALEKGVNFFDTANVYSSGESEKVLGRAIKDFANRDEVVIATKVLGQIREGPNGKGLSRKAIFSEIDKSLERLGMDYVDLYIIHRFDYETPLEETLEALNDAVRSGKARYIGASSMYAWQFMKALSIQKANGWARFVSMQNYYNLLYREEEREMLPLCRHEGIGVTPWSPLARGKLTRPWTTETKSLREQTDTKVQQDLFAGTEAIDKPVVDRLIEVAGKRGVPPGQVALAWQFHNPAVTAPLIGATKPQHLEDATAALSISLSEEEIRLLEEPYQPHFHTPRF
jgi:aryl-alcohol dehydrogenase-like predicted oxidoreductase